MLGLERENAGELWTNVLEEFRYHRQTADDDAGRELGVRPHAHGNHVVAYVRGLDYLPGIVSP